MICSSPARCLAPSDNFDAAGLSDFYNTSSSTIFALVQQFATFLDTLEKKTFDTKAIALTQGTSVGDLIDLPGTFQQGFVDLIKLPPNTASTLISSITSGDPLGTSGTSAADLRITLRNDNFFDVDLDSGSPTTLGALTTLIGNAATADGVTASQFQVRTNPDGSISLVDYTAAASSSSEFKIEALQSLTAVSQLGLDAISAERDVNGDSQTEFVIDVAPNPGPNFNTLQQMVALANGSSATVIPTTSLAYTPNTQALDFLVTITRSFPEATDTLQLPDLGSLTGISTGATITVGNASGTTGDPTLTLSLPFELELTPIGFATPLSASTPLSVLNAGAGVPVVTDADDIQFQLLNGTTFTVSLDLNLGATLLSALNGGAGVRTNGTANPDIAIQLNDGTTFSVDLDSWPSPPTLADLVGKIQSDADLAVAQAGDFEGADRHGPRHFIADRPYRAPWLRTADVQRVRRYHRRRHHRRSGSRRFFRRQEGEQQHRVCPRKIARYFGRSCQFD